MMTPAALNLEANVESLGTLAPYKAKEPAVLFILSSVAMLFLIIIGIPCRGPLIVPFARSASNSAAMLTASGLTSVTHSSVPLTSLILAMYACWLSAAKNCSMTKSGAYVDEIHACKLASLKPSL